MNVISIEMDWQKFLKWKAFCCDLNREATDFFVWVFGVDVHVDLSRSDLACRYADEERIGTTEASCKNYLTEIYEKVGKDHRFEKTNRKLRELSQFLRSEFCSHQSYQEMRADSPLSAAEELNCLLQNLNYREQQDAFDKTIHLSAKAVLVRVEALSMQKWLVWRLVTRLYEQRQEREKPRCLMVKASGTWGAQPELFWRWLAGELQCSSEEPDVVLEEIIQLSQYRSHIFVIYEMDLLKSSAQKLLVESFWKPLVSRLSEQRGLGEGKCRLFLTETIDYQVDIAIEELITLDPWERVLVKSDMLPWLDRLPVLEFLKRTTRQSPQSLKDDWLQGETLGKPQKVIKLLGQAAGLEDGIEEMKPYWQLAA
jgi:hypothetical protein